jgi:lipid A 3-O-deacylase
MLMPQRKIKVIAAGFVFICWNTPSHAIDSSSFEVGTGNKTQLFRLGAQYNWDRQWFQSNGTHVAAYWDFTLAYWRGNRFRGISDNTQNIADIGVSPVFRLQRDDKTGWYGEAGIGAHLLSANYDNNDRKLSTNFQFGSHLGVGYVFRNKWDIGLKVQHFSNGGIRAPNNGVNFAVLRVGYQY